MKIHFYSHPLQVFVFLSGFLPFLTLSINLPPAKLDIALQHLIKECMSGAMSPTTFRQKQRIKVGTGPPRILTDTDVCVVFMCV